MKKTRSKKSRDTVPLRAAMNRTINKAKVENPGYQAKTNLDLNGKTLKCFIRPDVKPPGSWAPYGESIPLSFADMDPSGGFVRNAVSQNPTFSSPAGQRQKTRAVDNRTPPLRTQMVTAPTLLQWKLNRR